MRHCIQVSQYGLVTNALQKPILAVSIEERHARCLSAFQRPEARGVAAVLWGQARYAMCQCLQAVQHCLVTQSFFTRELKVRLVHQSNCDNSCFGEQNITAGLLGACMLSIASWVKPQLCPHLLNLLLGI
jgi:hypothetical protein